MSEKRALCLSGGGAKGAYQVGALKALSEIGRSWTSVHGISVGALNASWLAMLKPEDQPGSIDGLIAIWNGIKTSNDIYRPWGPFGLKYIMSMWKGSLNSGAPLRELVKKMWDSQKAKESGVKLTVGCCSLTTTRYRAVSGDNPKILEYILASSHLPLVFEPLLIDDEVWVDGGLRHQIPILEAIKENPDEIDIIITQPIINYETAKCPNSDVKSAPQVSMRAANIFSDQIYFEDCMAIVRLIINKGTKHHIKVNFYYPSRIPEIDSMNFDGTSIQKIIQMGYEETKIKLGKTHENNNTLFLGEFDSETV